jgi:putative PIG3 family NAD(P)H quinone oxidoreductase
MQRIGRYPPPPGASDIPGLEVAGTVAAVGKGAQAWQIGDRVCAILAGGGYAEYALAPAVQCLPLPEGVSMVEGAALPEALFTCWTNMIDDGMMEAGKAVLIHGGASGIGTIGIQLARAMGATVFVTAGSAEKCGACEKLGAARAINYRQEDFVEAIKAGTNGRGVDLVLDMVGADYVGRSLDVLAQRGRYVIIGVMKTPEATFSVAQLIGKHATLTGSTLRGRSPAEKGRIRDAIQERVWADVAARRITAVVDSCYPLSEAADAHRRLESGEHIGKVILTTRHLAE